jgi:hypothetical protein
VFVFQDTNEAEAENTDKEGDFNLKVSREPNAPRSPRCILIFRILPLEDFVAALAGGVEMEGWD